MKYNKIFVIGLNKTATTSFHVLFSKLKLVSEHSTTWDLNNPNIQCFSDGHRHTRPFEKAAEYSLPALDSKFPNSLFILNTRSLNNWLLSRAKFCYKRNKITSKKTWGWPLDPTTYELNVIRRKQHHANTLEYFKNSPEKLIIIDIETPNWQQFVGEQIGLDVPSNLDIREKSLPSSEIPIEIMEKINTFLVQTYSSLNISEKEIHRLDVGEEYLKIYKNNILIST